MMHTPDRPPTVGELPPIRGFLCSCVAGDGGAGVDGGRLAATSPAYALKEALRGLHELFVPPAYQGAPSPESEHRHAIFNGLARRALALAQGDDLRAAEIIDRFSFVVIDLSKPHFDACLRSTYFTFWRPILEQSARRRDADPRLINGLTTGARQLHTALRLLSDEGRAAAHFDGAAADRQLQVAALHAMIQEQARLVLLTLRYSEYRAAREAAYQAIIAAHLLYRLGLPLSTGAAAAWAAAVPDDARWLDFTEPLPAPERLWAALPETVRAAAGTSTPERALTAARSWFYKEIRKLVSNGENAGAMRADAALEAADKLHIVARWLVERAARLPTVLRAPGAQSLTARRDQDGEDDLAPWEPADPGPSVEDTAIADDPHHWEVLRLLDLALSKDQIWSILMRHALLLRAGKPWPPLDDRREVSALRAEQPDMQRFHAGYDPLALYAHLSSPAVRMRYPRLKRLAAWVPGPELQGRGEDAINNIITRQCREVAATQAAAPHLDAAPRRQLEQDLQYVARWLLGHERATPRPQRKPRRSAAKE